MQMLGFCKDKVSASYLFAGYSHAILTVLLNSYIFSWQVSVRI